MSRLNDTLTANQLEFVMGAGARVAGIGNFITPVTIVANSTIVPRTAAASSGGNNHSVYVVPAGYRFVCTYLSTVNSGAVATALYDGSNSTAIWDFGSVSTTAVVLQGVNIPFYREVLVAATGVTNTFNVSGYLEKI